MWAYLSPKQSTYSCSPGAGPFFLVLAVHHLEVNLKAQNLSSKSSFGLKYAINL